MVISIVETFLEFPPSLGVTSSVPIATECTLASLKNRLRVISAASTAVLMARAHDDLESRRVDIDALSSLSGWINHEFKKI